MKTAMLLAATIAVAAATAVSTALAQSTYEPFAITTLAGLAFTGGSADGTGSAARFLSPAGVAMDTAGNIYVADSGNHTIRKVTSGGVVTTVAGLAGSAGSVDGTGSAARFYQPEGVAVDSAGNIFVADSLSHIIRKITSGGVVTTLAGTPDFPGSLDGTGSAAQFFAPGGVAVDSAGNIFVADTYNNTIRKITSGGVVTTVAGRGCTNMGCFAGSADGTGSAARFNMPQSVAVDSAGNIDVADTSNYTIRRITSGGVVTTLAGLANTSGSADGTGSAARFANPDGVAVDGAGNVYVADSSNRTLRKITFDGVVTTLAGRVGGNQAVDGIGILAQFGYPYGVAASSTGVIAVGDYGGQTIRVGIPVGPLAPPHGGLSNTLFTVNGSTSSTANVADTVLRFAVQQTGRPAHLRVRVQSSTTPNVEASWTELPNGTEGHMTYDVSSNRFILNTTGYPLQNNISFRAISEAKGYLDSVSNVVGPFNLVSPTGTTHLGPIVLTGTAGGTIADLYFRVKQSTLPPGVALRVQSSATPADEPSWTDLSNGSAGHMQQSNDPHEFFLLTTGLPAADSVYFRAVASLAGDIDSLSGAIGPVKLTPDTPPAVTVTITPHTPPYVLSGTGTSDDPFVIAAGTFNFGATVQSDRQIRSLVLQVDGDTVEHFGQGASSGRTDYGTNVLSDHILEAVAIDDLGATSRAGTGAIYVRVIPAGGADGANGGGTDVSTGPKVFAVANSGGIWTDPATWVSAGGVHGVPGPEDLAVVGHSSVRFDLDARVGSVTITGGRLVGPGNLNVRHTFTMTAGTFETYIGLFIEPGATCNLLNSDVLHLAGKIYNQGTINLHGAAGLDHIVLFQNNGGVAFKYPLSIPLNAGVDAAAASRIIAAQTVTTSGIIHGLLPERLISQDGAGIVAAGGGVVSHDGASVVSHDGASLVTATGGTLVASGAGNIISEDAGSLVATGAGNLVATGAGNLVENSGGTSAANLDGKQPSGPIPSGFTQTGGETDLSAVGIVGPVTLNGGVLSGSGIIHGDLTNNGGFIAPEHVAVTGNFTQGANGTLIVRNGGALPNQFDQLQVGGTANLGGKLDLKTINGYTPAVADTFSPLGATSISGVFASVSANANVTMSDGGVLATDDITQPEPRTGQALNISTRMRVLTDANVLIAGFIVTGPSGSTKKVLIRGKGPSLAQSGVPGTLSDPLLELHKPDGSVVANDNWADAPNVGEIPPGFQPGDARESIVIATLIPGSYTAIVKGAHGETGIGLAEVYDLDSSSPAKLANISTRGFIDTGDNVMIGGFIVGGGEPARILVRAIGPTLSDFGVQGVLDDPVLELHDANGSSFNNDSWRESQEREITATTIPPHNNREPAILATLVPGNYTAIVRGKNDTTGIGLVEAYTL